MNPLFERFGGKSASTPTAPAQNLELLRQIRADPRGYAAQISANPAAFIKQRFGRDIPEGMNDPRQIIQYLFGPPPEQRR